MSRAGRRKGVPPGHRWGGHRWSHDNCGSNLQCSYWQEAWHFSFVVRFLHLAPDGRKLCTSYNSQGLISEQRSRPSSIALSSFSVKQHPSSCCKTVDIPKTNLYLGPGDTKCTQGKGNGITWELLPCFPGLEADVRVELISATVAPSGLSILVPSSVFEYCCAAHNAWDG